MGVKSVTTDWAQSQFGDDGAKVIRRVIRAMAAWHQSGLDAQAASGMTKKYPYGSVWSTRFDNLVVELHDLTGAEIIPVPGAGYQLVKLQGKVLIPFRLATTLPVHHSQAKIESETLRELTALSVPRPVPPPSLFDDTEADVAPWPARDGRLAIIDSDTSIIYIGVVANADSKSLLALLWGIGEAQSEDGTLIWSPEPLPLDILGPNEVPVRVPEHRTHDQVTAFDRGPVPSVAVTARSRPVEAPPTGDEPPIDPAASDDRE